MEMKDIKELILTVDKTSIQKVDIESKDMKISISKSLDHGDKVIEVKNKEIEKQAGIVEEKIEGESDDIFVVKSPIVGVFYSAASPGSEPFVKIGDYVNKGHALCIIEAMKMMNEIESETSGEIIEVMVKNEDTVEYGQPLMKIRR